MPTNIYLRKILQSIRANSCLQRILTSRFLQRILASRFKQRIVASRFKQRIVASRFLLRIITNSLFLFIIWRVKVYPGKMYHFLYVGSSPKAYSESYQEQSGNIQTYSNRTGQSHLCTF